MARPKEMGATPPGLSGDLGSIRPSHPEGSTTDHGRRGSPRPRLRSRHRRGDLRLHRPVGVVLFLIFIGIPFLIALGELLFIVLVALAGVVGRVLFRRPWTVDAVSPGGAHHDWHVVGWRASGAARQFIADRVRGTGTVPSDEEVSAAVLSS